MRHILKKIAESTVCIIFLILGAGILLFPKISIHGITSGLKICASSILPVLFPFFAVTDFCRIMGYTDLLTSAATPLTRRLFHAPGKSATSLLLGLIGGYPVGARTVIQQYSDGELTKREAERILLFCNNAGPSFIIGIVGAGMFQSVKIGLVLYLIHCSAAAIIGISFRPSNVPHDTSSVVHSRITSISQAVTNSIKNAGQSTIHICAFILFFSVLNGYLTEFLPKQVENHIIVRFILSSLELAGGLTSLSGLSNQTVLFCICSFMLGWGGLCVYFQTMTMLDGTDLSPKGYLCSKTLHGLISFLIAVSISPIINFTGSGQVINIEREQIVAVAVPFTILGLLLYVLFLKKPSGKAEKNAV